MPKSLNRVLGTLLALPVISIAAPDPTLNRQAEGGLGAELQKQLEKNEYTVAWFNADEIRKKFDDWDFSEAGRIRQSIRMTELAATSNADYVIADFVAPLVEMRNNFKADWTIWIDTIDRGRFEDTNKMFVPPTEYDFRIIEQDADKWSEFIADHIADNKRRPTFDWQKETVQMLGRWQPWHEGHRKLFERSIAKTGQVVIQIRDCQNWNDSNPFTVEQVKEIKTLVGSKTDKEIENLKL